MRDDEGRFFCDHCRRRCSRGGLRVTHFGETRARRVRTNDETAMFCSDTCLRDALFGLNPAEDEAEQLRQRISRLEAKERTRARGRREQEIEDRQQEEVSLLQSAAHHVAQTLSIIREQELTRSIDQSDQGKQLRRCLDAIERAIPAERARPLEYWT